jgi:hypothetical protein
VAPDPQSSSSNVERPRRLRPAGPLAAALFLVTGAVHFYLQPEGATYTGPLAVFDHVFGIFVAVLLLAASTAIGRFVLARFRLAWEQPLEEIGFCTAVGAALISTSYLACGLASVLNGPVVILVPIVAAATARRELAELPSLWARAIGQVRSQSEHPAYLILAAIVFGVVAIALAIQASAPPADWDSLMYHLEVPRLFLEEGRVFLPRASRFCWRSPCSRLRHGSSAARPPASA